jgi:hypothetical protein
MGNHHYWKNLSVEGIPLVGCTTFFPTASSRIMTFEVLHNTCCENDSCSKYQALQELSYKLGKGPCGATGTQFLNKIK